MLNIIVGIRLSAHWKANVNRNVWCIKWKYIVIRVMIAIQRYIFWSTQEEFKTRYYNHRTSFSHEKYRHSTTLSSYVWEVKDKKGIDPLLKWEVIKKCHKYRAGDRDCLLCKEEKLAIASCKSRVMLNQRSEVLNSCKHKRGWLLYN